MKKLLLDFILLWGSRMDAVMMEPVNRKPSYIRQKLSSLKGCNK